MIENVEAISPYLTVIVPVFNEATTILIVCERVAAELPENSECLLVDDASTDQTLLQLSRQSSEGKILGILGTEHYYGY